MTGFDFAVLVIIGFSVLVGVLRGVVREVVALAGWILAFYVAKTYAVLLLPLLPAAIPTESIKTMAAFLILFFAVLLITSLLSIALSGFIKKIGLNSLNRSLGAMFGLLRGIVIVSVLVLLAGMTKLPSDVRWTSAMFSAPFEALVTLVLPHLPETVAKHVSFNRTTNIN